MALNRTRPIGALAAAALVAAATLADARPAAAQQAAQADSVKGDGKGIVGGALLGGEIVMIPMAAFGVDRAWPYLVFGGLGAVGGGVGGFFIEDATTDSTEVPLYMLAGGMALVIPTLVAVLNATAYKPPESDTKEQPATPTKEPAPGGGTSVKITSQAAPAKRTASAAPQIPTSLVAVRSGELGVGVPAVEVRPLYTKREQVVFGVAQGEEVRVPVFKAQF